MSADAPPDVSMSPAPIVQGEPAPVADGVFVIPDRRVELVPNVGIVVGDTSVLVIDTGMGPRNGSYVLERARALAPGRKMFLTVTHFHPEHGFGAQAFRDEATIVFNRGQRTDLRRKGPGYLQMFRGLSASTAEYLAGVELVDPDITYEGELELDLGARTALLRSVGPAHTGSDQVVLVDDRVLFGGDLLETDIFPITPYFPPYDTDTDGDGWIRLLHELISWQPEVVVPGHGEVSDINLLHRVAEYLSWVRDEARRIRRTGVSADTAVATIDATARQRWPRWERPEWIAHTARAFYDRAES
ncbi:MBL fold metallo-hydrolase [Flexivirga meconopsidis]|uniref:MBL fold metallo-hydrolase n=1 Tax=Flexivirga meconopsidis TaxID=2977121 RepID=UPI00223F6D45|nr:MBL fold metallo-hydrolase [Flexivirga meconopsidis]